jgi:hypothetical protein
MQLSFIRLSLIKKQSIRQVKTRGIHLKGIMYAGNYSITLHTLMEDFIIFFLFCVGFAMA